MMKLKVNTPARSASDGDSNRDCAVLRGSEGPGLTFHAKPRPHALPEDADLAAPPRERLTRHRDFSGHETFRNIMRIPGAKPAAGGLREARR